jgi:general secretion pathway protein N
MRRLLAYVLLGLLAYTVFLVLLCPAGLLIEQLAQRLPGFSAQSVQGSAVQGTAQSVQLSATARLEAIAWRLRVLPLLLGRIEYDLQLTAPELNLRGIAGLGLDRQFRIAALNGQLPLPRAIALAGRPPPPLNGMLELENVGLSLNRDYRPTEAGGLIRLHNLSTSFGTPLSLGNFEIQLQIQASALIASIQDQGGPLQLNGNLTLDPDGRYRFTAQAAPRDQDNRELYQALSLLGRPGGNGKWTFDFAGNLKV